MVNGGAGIIRLVYGPNKNNIYLVIKSGLPTIVVV
jgi:hypothetical protein